MCCSAFLSSNHPVCRLTQIVRFHKTIPTMLHRLVSRFLVRPLSCTPSIVFSPVHSHAFTRVSWPSTKSFSSTSRGKGIEGGEKPPGEKPPGKDPPPPDTQGTKRDVTPTDDTFDLDDFLVHEEEVTPSVEDVQKEIDGTPESELSDELASELVDRMVAATKLTPQGRRRPNILNEITPHTVSVLRASRIVTYTVTASGTNIFTYPIERRVKAELWVDQLNLSAPAREALLILAGRRVQQGGSWIKLSYDRFPTKDENRAYIVTLLDRLVAAAKNAVGEEVDRTCLNEWRDVVEEVRRQAASEIEDVGGIENLLGSSKLE